MTTINVTIESYGMIKTALPSALNIVCAHGSDVDSILQRIALDHVASVPLLEQCACAIADEMVSRQTKLYADSTLVLLSPVAGG